ncbi:NADH-quinone oxidoreductase subunit D [Acidobacteriota bacterium]
MSETEILEINMGPQHPSTHGVLRLILHLDGETVVDCDCDIGYLHRGLEKLCEVRTYPQALTLTDRMDYIAAISNNLGYLEAVEKLLQIEVPRRAQYIRVMMTELNRIASHLLWLATHAIDIGAMTVFLYCFREREKILDIFEKFCGTRLTTSTFRIGGLREDLPKGCLEEVKAFCDTFPKFINDYETLLTMNRIWLERTKGIGVISAEDAIAWGLSGPVLRGSGVKWDIRKAYPYEVYSELEFEVPIGKVGDTYDRYLCRMEELRQSNRIILQTVEGLPEGDLKAKTKKIIRPPAGRVYHSIEAPKGELGYLIVSDGSPNPYRVKVRPPSFINLQAIPALVKGHLVADVVAVIGTLDIVLGEIDR